MTDQEFEALVAKLEQEARRDPAGYQTRTFLLALLGNLYLGAVLLLLGGALLISVLMLAVLKAAAVKLIIILGAFLWMVLKALWIRFPPPEGTEIKRGEAGELFGLIDELRRLLRGPRFHYVLLTEEFNAAVVQVPRFGIFGGHRNYLLLGLPLMKLLSVEQFRAVLAHEFGHLARGHGRLSNWIYGQRLRWGRLLATLEQHQSSGAFLFKPFLKRFTPYFNAYSFPLARANEYEADATAARLTSPQAMAEALTGVNVVGSYLSERYWPFVYRQADDHPQPAFAPYGGMDLRVAGEVDEATTSGWTERAMARQTNCSDTHPSLKDRLDAIGAAPCLAPPAPGAAADRLLGAALARVTETFDRRWHDAVRDSWEKRHREVQEGRARLAELNERHAQGGELALQEAWDRAVLTESMARDDDGALEQMRALHARAPEDPVICFGLGSRLLAREDDGGMALIERAMELDEAAIVNGCEVLRDYCWRRERREEALRWHERMVERARVQEESEQERSHIFLADRFMRHGLDDATIARLKSQLQTVPGLRRAWLLRKEVRHFPERPCYVFAYKVTGMFQLHSKKRVEQVLAAINERAEFPADTRLFNVDGDNYRFGRKFRWMRGVRIY